MKHETSPEYIKVIQKLKPSDGPQNKKEYIQYLIDCAHQKPEAQEDIINRAERDPSFKLDQRTSLLGETYFVPHNEMRFD